MKKYKLIQEYPRLPKSMKVGNNVIWNDTFQNYHHPLTLDIFKKEEIENYPNFWQEIKVEYEILSFRENKVSKIAQYATLRENGLYVNSPDPKTKGCYTTEEVLDDSYWEIYSVKRHSDGEIFTIGDRIKSLIDKDSFVIKGFNDKHQKGHLGAFEDENNWIHIDYTKKVPVIFTTEDGVTITDPDKKLYGILLDSNLSFDCLASDVNQDKCKVFDSEKERDNYKVKNTPLLSYFDVEKILDDDPRYSLRYTKERILSLSLSKSKQ